MFYHEPPKRRVCARCNRAMPKSIRGDVCPSCQDEMLFQEVKDYLHTHHATELQLAEHFHIPLQKVRGWIRAGRIEYRELH